MKVFKIFYSKSETEDFLTQYLSEGWNLESCKSFKKDKDTIEFQVVVNDELKDNSHKD